MAKDQLSRYASTQVYDINHCHHQHQPVKGRRRFLNMKSVARVLKCKVLLLYMSDNNIVRIGCMERIQVKIISINIIILKLCIKFLKCSKFSPNIVEPILRIVIIIESWYKQKNQGLINDPNIY